MSPQLPLELQILILNNILNDPSVPAITLRECALSSKAWLQILRPVFFRNLTLHYIVEVGRLLDTFAASPHLASLVESVVVQSPPRPDSSTSAPLYYSDADLSYVLLHDGSTRLLVDLLRLLPSLLKLTVLRCALYEPDLHALISAAATSKSLQELELEDCKPLDSRGPTSPTSPVASNLRRVTVIDRVSETTRSSLTHFLARWNIGFNAQSLVFHVPQRSVPENADIIDFIRMSANTLVELELGFSYRGVSTLEYYGECIRLPLVNSFVTRIVTGTTTPEMFATALSTIPNLKTLTLITHTDYANLWSPTLGIINLLKPLPIHHLRIDIPHLSPEELAREKENLYLRELVDVELRRRIYDCLREILAREPNILPELQKLEFVYHGAKEKEQEWKELMLNVFWLFREKGVLSLTVGDPAN